MKTIIKIVIVIAIAVAIFGGATVKSWLGVGVDKGVDAISSGVTQFKNSSTYNDLENAASSYVNEAKSKVSNSISDAISGVIN